MTLQFPESIWFALGSAFFAALPAIFGKLGVLGMNSNLATLIRTIVIVAVITAIISARGEWQKPDVTNQRGWLFLVLSALATGLSWMC